jgi:hypothetical protein
MRVKRGGKRRRRRRRRKEEEATRHRCLRERRGGREGKREHKDMRWTTSRVLGQSAVREREQLAASTL